MPIKVKQPDGSVKVVYLKKAPVAVEPVAPVAVEPTRKEASTQTDLPLCRDCKQCPVTAAGMKYCEDCK